MVPWRVYYGDGTTWDGDPFDAPGLNVQAVVQADAEVGRHVVTGFDFYWWEASHDRWWGGDLFGLWDYLSREGPRKVIFARTMMNAEYRAVFDRAVADPDFAPKSAVLRDERRWVQ